MIKIENLTKNYGNNKGVFNLCLEIKKGEVVGFLGANGAGKTTTIRHLMGFLNSDSGICTINNLDCRKQSSTVKNIVGYVAGETQFFDDMKGGEYLLFIQKMRGAKCDDEKERLIKYFEFDVNQKIKKMSKGTKQKLALISAFMFKPEVLILDEPTSGLDPLMQNKFAQLVLEQKQNGKTVLISSHSFEEIEKTCDKIAMIKEGKLIDIKIVADIQKDKKKIFVVTFESKQELEEFLKEDIKVERENELCAKIELENSSLLKPIFIILSKYNVTNLEIKEQKIEDIFMKYYGG